MKQDPQVKRLLRVVKKLKPVKDSSVTWLRLQRPSAALLCCLGSGPWKIGRRTTVQTHALKLLGKKDLSQVHLSQISKYFPLQWQRNYLAAAVSHAKIERERTGRSFDDLFAVTGHVFPVNLDTVNRAFHEWKEHRQNILEGLYRIHCYAHDRDPDAKRRFRKPLPKVLGMFIRDFMYHNVVPVDRHVRKWLKERNLPTHPDRILALFEQANLPAREYARAMFLNVSENPQHEPTCSDAVYFQVKNRSKTVKKKQR